MKRRSSFNTKRREIVKGLGVGAAVLTVGPKIGLAQTCTVSSGSGPALPAGKWLQSSLMATVMTQMKASFNFSYTGIDTTRTLPARAQTRWIDPVGGNDGNDGKRYATLPGTKNGPWKTLNSQITNGAITSAFNNFRLLFAVGQNIGPSNYPGSGSPVDFKGMYRLVGVTGLSMGPYNPAAGAAEIVTQDLNPFQLAAEQGKFLSAADLAAKYWGLDVGAAWAPVQGQNLNGPSCISIDGACSDIIIRGVAMQGFGEDAIRVASGGWARLEDYWVGNSKQNNFGTLKGPYGYVNPNIFTVIGTGTLHQIRGWEDSNTVDRLVLSGRPKGYPIMIRQVACAQTTTANWAGGQHSDEAQSAPQDTSVQGGDGYDAKWLCWQHYQPHTCSYDGNFYQGQAGLFNGTGSVANKQYCLTISDCNLGYVDLGGIYNIRQCGFIALPQNTAQGGGGGAGFILYAGTGGTINATDLLFWSAPGGQRKLPYSDGGGKVVQTHVDTTNLIKLT